MVCSGLEEITQTLKRMENNWATNVLVQAGATEN